MLYTTYMEETKTERIIIPVTPSTQKWLKEASYNWRLPMAQIVRNAIDEYIEKRGKNEK